MAPFSASHNWNNVTGVTFETTDTFDTALNEYRGNIYQEVRAGPS